jgi:plasmid stability protein
VATIQIRDVPDDVYETIRRRAREAGQSLQAYMRDHVIDFGRMPTTSEAWRQIEVAIEKHGGSKSSIEEIVAQLHADRR